MPHIFSWRPKLKVGIKKLSHHIGELGHTLSPGNSPPPRILQIGDDQQQQEEDFIVDSTPKLSALSDLEDEPTSYFYASRNTNNKPLDSSGSYANNFEEQSSNNSSGESNGKRRAVHFFEGLLSAFLILG